MVLVLVLSLTVLSGVGYLIVFSGVFAIRDINYYGSSSLPMEKLKTVEADIVGRSLFTPQLKELKETLLKSPVVKDVVFKRKPLHNIECYIIERKPVALIMGDEPVGVDEDGVILREGIDLQNVDLPILTGVDKKELGEDSGRRKIRKAMTVLRLYKESGFDGELEVSEIHVKNEDVILVVGEHGTIVRYGRDGYLEATKKLRAICKILGKSKDFPSMIDLRFDGQVVVR